MSWLWAIISGAFSGLMQGFLGLFGMSDAQKLGRAEVRESDRAETIKELSDRKAIINGGAIIATKRRERRFVAVQK